MLKKRLEFGFSGYQMPVTPQATRSARRPVFLKNLEPESHESCAFDLLATVAGNILLEKESLEKNGEKMNESILNVEIRDHGSCSKNFPSQFTSDDDERSSGCTQLKNITVIESMDRDSCPLQKNYPFKKRKSFYCSNSDGGVTSEAIPCSPETSRKYHGGLFYILTPGSLPNFLFYAISVKCCHAVAQTSSSTDVSSLKLKIKSFKVPELFISVPETATVGFLKKSIMEAVGSLLGGGMQVGVLLRGKKVGDDDKILTQIGISRNHKPDSLNFILEPNPPPLSDSASSEPLTRFPAGGNMVNFGESDGDSEVRVMVAVPQASMEALTLIPLQQKAKKLDAPQRRVRRPFSVSEVEALVQAVETLGTGRWRDVKLHAFFHAKHRTYVDLKDKWKTLVHTARISPQQRRGEPVPQELLDRVLVAHAYWSQQHGAVPETRLLLGTSS